MVFAYNTIFIIPYPMRVYRSCVELCSDWLLPSSVASEIRHSAIFCTVYQLLQLIYQLHIVIGIPM